MSLKFKGGYELEFAIDSENEFKALKILADVFGENIKREIKFPEVAKRDELVFITHRFTKDELSDDSYKKLLKNEKTLLIIKDELCVKRAAKLLEICIPIETALKRLLIYVWSEISSTLDNKHDKKAKLDICSQINCLYLGDLLKLLEVDLSSKKREMLLVNNGKLLSEVLNESENFMDFKQKLIPYITPKTVWEQVNIMLKEPIEYSFISGQLHGLKKLRDKAAHHHTILLKDLNDAKKYSKHILSRITNVRNDYYDELSESIQAFTKTMSEAFKKFPSDAISQIIPKNTFNLSNTLNEAIAKMTKAPKIDLGKIIEQTNWNAINGEMRANDPEMKEILESFDKKGANDTIKEMQKEIDEGVNNDS